MHLLGDFLESIRIISFCWTICAHTLSHETLKSVRDNRSMRTHPCRSA
ncbi:hypothetical protein HMPREF1985_01051 [Mitsuokella sp. oral taxon 131 str. W9106]|nr:hypothetical protein HMPREF1985_01051 [Mitsuokella sp. oral taxon 131 str. W9106]